MLVFAAYVGDIASFGRRLTTTSTLIHVGQILTIIWPNVVFFLGHLMSMLFFSSIGWSTTIGRQLLPLCRHLKL